MTHVIVRHEDGDRFIVSIRGHQLVTDQPVQDGGTDAGPTPTELFVAALASCIGFYAERFLRRHELSEEGLAVDSTFGFAKDRPARVAWITLVVEAPGLPASKREAFQAVVEHCTVHNSMRESPLVQIEVGPSVLAA